MRIGFESVHMRRKRRSIHSSWLGFESTARNVAKTNPKLHQPRSLTDCLSNDRNHHQRKARAAAVIDSVCVLYSCCVFLVTF
jgi:hypothetical protein